MKTVCIKEIDNIGRIVLPMELRKMLHLQAKDRIEISYDQEREGILIRRWRPSCAFCGGQEALICRGDRFLCKQCLEEFKKAAASV